MKNPTFYIVDVFAEEKYAGNQLAIVRGADRLPDETLQKIASETTFILSEEEKDGGYDVRIFTPGGEIPFAGHPTLGTAFILRQEVLARHVERLSLNLKVGKIPVTFGEMLWMEQLPPVFGDTPDPALTARALDLDEADLDDRYPVQEVSTGLPFIVTSLESLDALKRCRIDQERYSELVAGREARAILVFAPEPHDEDNDLSARMFAPALGVPEDPATGSANGCLARYFVEHRYLGTDSIDIRIEQGYEIGRPSLLYLRARRSDGEISVSVGVKVQMVARGELL